MMYVLILILFIVIIIFVMSAVIFNLSLNRYTDKSAIFNKDINNKKSLDIKETITDTKWFNENKKEVSIKSIDNLKLTGYIINNKSDKWIILVHGYASDHTTLINKAKKFFELGYQVLLVDQRSHGKSEGKYITMGIKESNDIKLWIDYIIRIENAKEIGLFGISMGAATIMMTIGLVLPKEVKFAIEDCGYSDVYDELKYQLKKGFHLPAFPFINVCNLYAKSFAKFTFKIYSPKLAVSRTNIPLLMIHGSYDTFVPYEMLNILYDSCKSRKEKLIIEGANHAEAENIEYDKYWKTITSFIKEQNK